MLYEEKQSPEVFCKKGFLRNFAKFTAKYQCQSMCQPATLLKRKLCHRCFPVSFCEISKNNIFYRTPLVAASAATQVTLLKLMMKNDGQIRLIIKFTQRSSTLIDKVSALDWYKLRRKIHFLPGSQKTFVESCGRRNWSPNNYYKCSLYLTGKVSTT